MRCKKVKNKPKVNQELSILEYKKKLAEMERKLATQNAQIVKIMSIWAACGNVHLVRLRKIALT